MNKLSLKEAVKCVFDELSSMNEEEFYKEIEKHQDGEIADILSKTGAFDDNGQLSEVYTEDIYITYNKSIVLPDDYQFEIDAISS